jgi:predicted ribosomally synthesized peptide with nif11-like leader
LQVDEEFRNEILAVEDMDERLKLVKAAGFDCTAEEIEAEQSEMSDDDLDDVDGGYGDCAFRPYKKCFYKDYKWR